MVGQVTEYDRRTLILNAHMYWKAAYCYYVLDSPILSDTSYDELARWVESYKDLVTASNDSYLKNLYDDVTPFTAMH
jgi:NAD-dependent DNA ligase